MVARGSTPSPANSTCCSPPNIIARSNSWLACALHIKLACNMKSGAQPCPYLAAPFRGTRPPVGPDPQPTWLGTSAYQPSQSLQWYATGRAVPWGSQEGAQCQATASLLVWFAKTAPVRLVRGMPARTIIAESGMQKQYNLCTKKLLQMPCLHLLVHT